MEEIFNILENALLSVNTSILLSCLFIVTSAILKVVVSLKEKTELCRSCFYNKIGKLIALMFGLIIFYLVNTKIVLIAISFSIFSKELKVVIKYMSKLGIDINIDEAEDLIKNEISK